MNRNLAIPFVKSLCCSYCTDEVFALGACYLNKKNKSNKSIKNIYLGQNISSFKITETTIIKKLGDKNKYLVKNIKEVAKQKKRNNTIARDKEEFGSSAWQQKYNCQSINKWNCAKN